ncbi:MAG: PKD domain-containing protein [Thermoplasmata archaeon]|nr:PKD domain-containing protein [Thermoplasmata archaeon]
MATQSLGPRPFASHPALASAGALGIVAIVIFSGLGLPLLSPRGSAGPMTAPSRVGSVQAAALAEASASLTVQPAVSGSPWTNLSANLSLAPTAREGAAMAYDPADGRVLLFGGSTGNRTAGDTWAFARGHWSNLTPGLAVSPKPRQHGGFVYDATDSVMVLFGGHDGSLYLNDTWTFNGTAWNQENSIANPTPREDVMMADDPNDGYVLMFGGEETSGLLTNDTWTYTGGQWTNETATLTKGVAPPPREDAVFAYDTADHYAVLFSGKRGATGLYNDTWTFSGGTWTNITWMLAEPAPREAAMFTYDAVDGFLLLFGGLKFPTPFNDQWTFSAGHWTQQIPATSPTPRFDAAMSYYPNQGLGFVLLFGGQASSTVATSLLNDTWTYKVPLLLTVTAQPDVLDIGDTAQLMLNVTGGYIPYVAYTWQGLPQGCASANATLLNCTPTSSGNYSVTARVNDSGGHNETSVALTLTVNANLTVTANASTYSGQLPLFVNFTSNVSGGTAPFTYAWFFGDGGASATATPLHEFTTKGVYTTALTVTDARSHSTTATLSSITVSTPPIPLTASATAFPQSGTVPLTVQFTATSNGGVGLIVFNWTFGVGNANSRAASTQYTYETAGVFTARLMVNDASNGSYSQNFMITVASPMPFTTSASASPTTGFAPLPVKFSATASGGHGGFVYGWLFAPGVLGSGQTADYTFANPGTYLVNLTVTDAVGARNWSTVTVLVLTPLSTSFVATIGAPYCNQGSGVVLVTVNATSAGGIGGDTYTWSFPNGAGTGANTSTTVSAGTSGSIHLTTADSQQNTATSTQSVNAPSISCVAPASNTTTRGSLLLFALIGIVGAVIVLELVLLLRKRKSK